MTTKSNKPTAKAKNAKVMLGIDKNLASMQAIVLSGVQYTPDQLKAVYQADNDAIDATESAHKTLQQKVLNEGVSRAKTAKVTSSLRSFLIGHFGAEAVAVLGDFGMNAPKPRATKTAAGKALAAAKAVATRKARGVSGSVKRKAVSGGVTGAVVTGNGAGAQIAPQTATGTSPAANAGTGATTAGSAASATPAGGAQPAATPPLSPSPSKAGTPA